MAYKAIIILLKLKEIKMAEDKKVITIDDKDYTEDQLTDAQKVMINHVNSLQQKINSAEFNLDQLKVGKQAFMTMLKNSLEESEEASE
tara:strand:- start:38 stop:301 length:264 start_codon:yes stop_codon:yes gene_type:complete